MYLPPACQKIVFQCWQCTFFFPDSSFSLPEKNLHESAFEGRFLAYQQVLVVQLHFKNHDAAGPKDESGKNLGQSERNPFSGKLQVRNSELNISSSLNNCLKVRRLRDCCALSPRSLWLKFSVSLHKDYWFQQEASITWCDLFDQKKPPKHPKLSHHMTSLSL